MLQHGVDHQLGEDLVVSSGGLSGLSGLSETAAEFFCHPWWIGGLWWIMVDWLFLKPEIMVPTIGCPWIFWRCFGPVLGMSSSAGKKSDHLTPPGEVHRAPSSDSNVLWCQSLVITKAVVLVH